MAVTGTGSQADPHVVTTWADLVAQSGQAGTLDNVHYVKLGNDIDMKDIPLSTYWDINTCVDVNGDKHKISNIQLANADSYYGLIKMDGYASSGSTVVVSSLHDITTDNILYTNTNSNPATYGFLRGCAGNSGGTITKELGGFKRVKMSGRLTYTSTPVLVIGDGYYDTNSFNFDYYAPALPTRGIICSNYDYGNSKYRNELRAKANLSSNISGVLWGLNGGNSGCNLFKYNSLFAEINALEGCATATAPSLFYNSGKAGYPTDSYCVIKSNVNGLVIPLANNGTYVYPSHLLFQNNGDGIATIGTTGINTANSAQLIGISETNLKSATYLNNIGFACTEVT